MLRVFRAVAFGIAPVPGDGSQRLSLVYGPDLAQALVAASLTPAAIAGTFYPAHPEIVTNRELLAILGQAIGRRVRTLPIPSPLVRAGLWATEGVSRLSGRATLLTRDKGNELLEPAWLCDPAPLTRTTGWFARHDLQRGAPPTFEWYRRHGWL
jgi:nucleoside-diphosphate-sugar epimerase